MFLRKWKILVLHAAWAPPFQMACAKLFVDKECVWYCGNYCGCGLKKIVL